MNLPSLLDRRPRVALVRLQGTITPRPGFGPGISLASTGPVLDRAFALRRLSAVFLLINSPGGSAVQSNLVAARIRRLSEEKKVPVIACVEDAAASGGYWIACAADEIVADPASILGSIGVIAQGFGFQGALERLGVERRLRTAGTEKSFWDPFRPESPEDAARLETLLEDMHAEFRAWVLARRGDRLRAPAEQLFTGRFWPGRKAVELGLADRLGDAVGEAKRRFGEKVRLIPVGGPRPSLLRRLLPGLSAEALVAAAEDRAAWARLGL
ncbi:S49 family peptidase [Paracraurococcus lichenis]|uniref:S49 family peptidase n=1 Tax=Paracraurococcus lichenis TaxID=3064888 RepID=A0ABT9E0Y2_9PROT|nr:S49 family peptidase [Paracraurococcus sp. LOR1-02]MDO9709826.1 S49 family peptidase [Paracraurococcus sp. LOR1-02]